MLDATSTNCCLYAGIYTSLALQEVALSFLYGLLVADQISYLVIELDVGQGKERQSSSLEGRDICSSGLLHHRSFPCLTSTPLKSEL